MINKQLLEAAAAGLELLDTLRQMDPRFQTFGDGDIEARDVHERLKHAVDDASKKGTCSEEGCLNDRELYSDKCEEHRNPRQPRVETERCSAKLRVPTANGKAEVVFQCEYRIEGADDPHGKPSPHRENGYVIMADGTHRKYTMTWTDEGNATFRQRPSRAKVRNATGS